MKQFKFITTLMLLMPLSMMAQRDTLDETKLISYPNIVVTDLGSTNSVDTKWKDYNSKWYKFIDTIQESYFPDYVDSLITIAQQDSVEFQSNLENMYAFYVHWNNQFTNTKRLLVKLWAIKP